MASARVGFGGGVSSLKERHAASFVDVGRAHVGWSCLHLQRPSHWHQSGRWGRMRVRGTRRG